MDATPSNAGTPSTFEEWLEKQINFAHSQMVANRKNNTLFGQWSTEWQNLCRVQMSYDRYKSKSLAAQPKCKGCGNTENLTECRAIPDSTYHLCARCIGLENEA